MSRYTHSLPVAPRTHHFAHAPSSQAEVRHRCGVRPARRAGVGLRAGAHARDATGGRPDRTGDPRPGPRGGHGDACNITAAPSWKAARRPRRHWRLPERLLERQLEHP